MVAYLTAIAALVGRSAHTGGCLVLTGVIADR